MSDTKKYEVTRKHCLNYKLGEVVELTEDKAKKLTGKVKLYEPKLDQADQDEELKEFISNAEAAVKEATERADQAEADLVTQTERADQAEAELAKLKTAAQSSLTENKATQKKVK